MNWRQPSLTDLKLRRIETFSEDFMMKIWSKKIENLSIIKLLQFYSNYQELLKVLP